ncbi:NAD-dependent epimerase/dehydratase family protein [Dactylosporangium sp. CA-052675]|uniref:NAD-dependent epimerase/dehydratase family protein n=1 Tax=Dactylosporangium sp. CA-052675 TaxID=3239927 RepID=UPI003D902462
MRIAVTGAAGFVGGAVARAAAGAGWRVHAFGRAQWDIDRGPLPDPPAVDAVVHCAAGVNDWGPAAPTWRTNVDGTRHVAQTFPGVRLVHISSASVYDPFVPTVCAREDAAPVSRYLTAYAASKAAAERFLASRPATVVLRPHAVYGPGDRVLLPRILGAIRGSNLWIVGDGRTRQSLTAIGNLVDAALRACEPDAPPGVYNVGDAEPVAVADALRELLAARGLRVGVRTLPVRPAWAVAGAAEAAWRLARRRRPPRLTRYAIAHLAMERTLDLTAGRTRMGLRPAPTSFAGAETW